MGYSANKTDQKVFNWLIGEAMLNSKLSDELLAGPSRDQIIADLPLSPGAAKSIISASGEFDELSEFADFVYRRVFRKAN